MEEKPNDWRMELKDEDREFLIFAVGHVMGGMAVSVDRKDPKLKEQAAIWVVVAQRLGVNL